MLHIKCERWTCPVRISDRYRSLTVIGHTGQSLEFQTAPTPEIAQPRRRHTSSTITPIPKARSHRFRRPDHTDSEGPWVGCGTAKPQVRVGDSRLAGSGGEYDVSRLYHTTMQKHTRKPGKEMPPPSNTSTNPHAMPTPPHPTACRGVLPASAFKRLHTFWLATGRRKKNRSAGHTQTETGARQGPSVAPLLCSRQGAEHHGVWDLGFLDCPRPLLSGNGGFG